MESGVKRMRARAAIILTLLLAVTSCSVVESVAIVENKQIVDQRVTGTIPVACQTSLGSYALPKSLVHVTVSASADGQKGFTIAPKPTRVPENRFTFCLDHLVNGFADDAIRVLKTNSSNGTAAGQPPWTTKYAPSTPTSGW